MPSGACLSARRRLIGCRFELLLTTEFIALYAYMAWTIGFFFKFLVF